MVRTTFGHGDHQLVDGVAEVLIVETVEDHHGNPAQSLVAVQQRAAVKAGRLGSSVMRRGAARDLCTAGAGDLAAVPLSAEPRRWIQISAPTSR